MRWFLLSLFFACTAHAQEIVRLNTRARRLDAEETVPQGN